MDAPEPTHPLALRADRVLAPAKVNLALHVTGRRPDGYHTLDSLVVFAAEGDRLTVSPSAADRLTIGGPFAADLPAGGDNIVLRALRLARDVASGSDRPLGALDIHLEKRLPVAAGIGGGSADAAALLRLLGQAFPPLRRPLRERALAIGADVPMCCDGVPARISGVGEISEPLPPLPALPLVLINPAVAVPTPAVFAALERRDHPPLPALSAGACSSVEALAGYLRTCRNDLEPPALALAPEIATAGQCLRREGALLARMSGSGATVFGIFASPGDAARAADAIRTRHPRWWTRATSAGAPDLEETTP